MSSASVMPPVLWMVLVLFALLAVSEVASQGVGGRNKRMGAVALDENKFRNRTPKRLDEIIFGVDASGAILDASSKCHNEFDIAWKAQLGGPIASTPSITNFFRESSKDLVIPLAHNYVEVLDARSGKKRPGWPHVYPEGTNSFAGVQEVELWQSRQKNVLVSTVDAELVFLGPGATPSLVIKVAPLIVKKDWYVGLESEDVEAVMSLYERSGPADTTAGIRRREAGRSSADTYAQRQMQRPTSTRRDLLQVEAETVFEGFTGAFTEEAIKSLDLFLNSNAHSSPASPSNSYSQFARKVPVDARERDPNYVAVPAHILATPAVVDLDGDGSEEVVVGVSYFFDHHEFMQNPEQSLEVDPDKYVATGVVVFDVQSAAMKWAVHLDLTTDDSRFRGYLSASPLVVDLDGDGKLEIIVGTGVGFVHVLDSEGEIKGGNFPLMLDSIQSIAPIAADLNEDGKLELVVMDSNGNLAVYDNTGNELWEKSTPVSTETPIIGDVNGDGKLEIVFATRNGLVYAVDALSGSSVQHFPVYIGASVRSPPTLTDLRPAFASPSSSLQILVIDHNGALYVIDGKTGCVDKVDLGFRSASAVLVDDVTGSGTLDLIVADESGAVVCLSTDAAYHPLRTWTSERLGANVNAYRDNYHGAYILEEDRISKQIHGNSFTLRYEIVDVMKQVHAPYKIEILVGEQRVEAKSVRQAGAYSQVLDLSSVRGYTHIRLRVTNKHGQVFSDELNLVVNVYYHRIYKWLLVGPFILMTTVLLFVKNLATPLPS